MPLSKEQMIKLSMTLEKAETSLKGVTADVADAKRAGLDVADQEKELNILRKTIRGIRNVYKPF